MSTSRNLYKPGVSRRTFLQLSAGSAAILPALARAAQGAVEASGPPPRSRNCLIKCAFVYPPTETLHQAGYYSWPGSGFDAEAHQQEYSARIAEMAEAMNVRIETDPAALDGEASAQAFTEAVLRDKPDGLLLILLKKGHWAQIKQIVGNTEVPAVIYAPLGVLLVDHINEAREMPGVYLINSERFEAVEPGLRMLRAAAWMRQSRILNIDGTEETSVAVPHLGVEILTVPHLRFYDLYRDTPIDDAVRALAAAYRGGARSVLEPNEEDILDAARCYHALRRLAAETEADALMMNCLPGLSNPHKHVPPCMAFMSLRDEGLPAGCQSDLNATLTLLLVQYLFDRPGFQQNASMDTEQNLYFGAHCTCPSRMNGPSAPPEPYILRSHAEAGWGCVPRVLLARGQEVTMAQYVSGDSPQMYVYTGAVVSCPETPPCGGCRTNVQMTINEVDDVRNVKGMHQIIFYGNHGRHLRDYCRLHSIEAVV